MSKLCMGSSLALLDLFASTVTVSQTAHGVALAGGLALAMLGIWPTACELCDWLFAGNLPDTADDGTGSNGGVT